MPQIFHRSSNTISRVSIFGALVFAAGGLWALDLFNRSAYMTGVAVARQQPVQFSHRHHAGELGIDCRYCHTAVERSSTAGVPPTRTCINCHAQIWNQSDFLEPVRASFRTDRSLEWIRVHDLPDFVYFDHSIHVAKGVGCVTCHGRVDQMNQIYKVATLQMSWCLDCHRQPERYVRPRERVFDMAWQPDGDQIALGHQLVLAYDIHTRTDCDACHR
jgi:hypothetical protein